MTDTRLTRKVAFWLFTVLMITSAVCYSAFVVYRILAASPEFRVQYVPDDAFYYMSLARNFSTQGQWSFDSGVSLTSGFHPLHAYLLAAVYYLLEPTAEHFVRISVLLSYLLFIPAGLAAAIFAFRCKHLLPAMLFLLFVLSRNVSLNIVSALEWSWVISFSTLYCLLFSLSERPRGSTIPLLLFGCGLLGSLARTDFGLLPAAFVAASLLAVGTPAGRNLIGRAFAGFVGACVGVLSGLFHNFLATGQALQSSAKMKSLWLQYSAPSVHPIMTELLELFGSPWARSPLVLSALLAIAVLLLGIRVFLRSWLLPGHHGTTERGNVRVEERTIWLASLFAIMGYIAFYSLNPVGTQNWYTANLVAPVFLALCLPIVHTPLTNVLSLASTLLVSILLVLQVPSAASFLRTREWPHQAAMYEAGQYLGNAKHEGLVGSWNAGIIGFYEGGHIVNLDGLVNNDIYAYAEQNKLADYIEAKSIKFLVDLKPMFTDDQKRLKGGYYDSDFLSRLKPIRQFDNRETYWSKLTLYAISPAEKTKSSGL